MPKRAAHHITLGDKLRNAVRHWGAAIEQSRNAAALENEAAVLVRDNPVPRNGEVLAQAMRNRQSAERAIDNAREQFDQVVDECLMRWREV